MAERFKRAFSHKNVKVHFVGAWYVIFYLDCVKIHDEFPGTRCHQLALHVERICFPGRLTE